MGKKGIVCIALIAIVCVMSVSVAHAEEETAGTKFKKFWQNLFGYPARLTEESVTVVTDTTKKGTDVIAREVKTVGQVTSGDLDKTKDLVVEPIVGTAKTASDAVVGTVKVPVEAARE